MRRTAFGHCMQITFLPGVFPVNCYLVKEDDDLTLIDTGLAYVTHAILKVAEQVGRPITRILLTHGHGDHVGGLDRLHVALPSAEVMMSERDHRLLLGDTSLDADEPAAKIKGDITLRQTKPTRFLAEGDRVGHLQVVSCPGHTPGHLAFLDVRDDTLIAGDAFQTKGGVAVSGTFKPFFPFPALATWHKSTALESARRLRRLRPSRLAVGHGRVISEPMTAMDRAIQQAERDMGRD
jgi:glyoxylase-like metal-dependent hydrolase (beta-lactamase superfamily II)